MDSDFDSDYCHVIRLSYVSGRLEAELGRAPTDAELSWPDLGLAEEGVVRDDVRASLEEKLGREPKDAELALALEVAKAPCLVQSEVRARLKEKLGGFEPTDAELARALRLVKEGFAQIMDMAAKAARYQLMMSNIRMVLKFARQWQQFGPQDFDDLVQVSV